MFKLHNQFTFNNLYIINTLIYAPTLTVHSIEIKAGFLAEWDWTDEISFRP